jgi:hypothetical protein
MQTTATDVFAAGTFTFDVLSLVAKAITGPKVPVLVPRRLWELCEQCISTEPGSRPEAIKAVFTLERLKDNEYGEKQNFELINLREVLHYWSNVNTSPVGSVEDIDTLLSRESLEDSLGRFF